MVAEVTITLKNDEKSLKTNHLIYDSFQASESDPIVEQLIQDTIKQFQAEADSIKVRINIEVK